MNIAVYKTTPSQIAKYPTERLLPNPSAYLLNLVVPICSTFGLDNSSGLLSVTRMSYVLSLIFTVSPLETKTSSIMPVYFALIEIY